MLYETKFETVPTTGETQFSSETRTALEAEGYRIYTLTGKSPIQLRQERRPINKSFDAGRYWQMYLPSLASEVAVHPTQQALPESNNKSFRDQLALVADYDQELKRRFPGPINAFIGTPSEYAELFFTHADATGEYLYQPVSRDEQWGKAFELKTLMVGDRRGTCWYVEMTGDGSGKYNGMFSMSGETEDPTKTRPFTAFLRNNTWACPIIAPTAIASWKCQFGEFNQYNQYHKANFQYSYQEMIDMVLGTQ